MNCTGSDGDAFNLEGLNLIRHAAYRENVQKQTDLNGRKNEAKDNNPNHYNHSFYC